MRRKNRLYRIALKIVRDEYFGALPEGINVTTSFRYFVKHVCQVNPRTLKGKLDLWLSTFLLSIIYYFVPSQIGDIIYLPKVYLRRPDMALGFLVHEMLHAVNPSWSEREVSNKSMLLMRNHWRGC